MSWSEHRKRVHRSATAKWKERSYEMRKIRRNLSAKARQLNAAANANRKHNMLDIAEADQVAAIHDNEITTHQLRLLKSTIDSGGIAADHDFMQPPAGYRPIALAEYAGRQYPSLSNLLLQINLQTMLLLLQLMKRSLGTLLRTRLSI